MNAVVKPQAIPSVSTTVTALLLQLRAAEMRFTVLTQQLPLFGLTHMAEGCAREAAAIRRLMQTVQS